jgi:hypothetical protein
VATLRLLSIPMILGTNPKGRISADFAPQLLTACPLLEPNLRRVAGIARTTKSSRSASPMDQAWKGHPRGV